MRGLNRFAASPGRPVAAALSAQTYSTFSGAGGDGAGGGRGRGRGSGFPPTPPPHLRVPGQPDPAAGNEDSLPPSFGHGRGHPPFPSSPGVPPFPSPAPSINPSFSAGGGRGRGRPSPPPSYAGIDHSHPKQPIFFRRSDSEPPPPDSAESVLPRSLPPIFSGSGRGKPISSPKSDHPVEENRHLRSKMQPSDSSPSSPATSTQPKLGSEEAVRKAIEVLSRGGPSGPGGRGRGGRGMVGRGRGRGGRFRGGRGRGGSDEAFDLYLGDNADGEKLEKMLGEEKMKMLEAGFEEIGYRVLPSPMEEAYLDALHTNNLIEYEPEYDMEFDTNPDIDEKPPMSLEEVLDKLKPFLIAFTGMKSQEEWEEAMEDLRERLPYLKELVDRYSGPERVTAKKQQEELERLASTLPENVPSSVRRFTDRAVLSLQSNPGWSFNKKCQFMNMLTQDVSQHYKRK